MKNQETPKDGDSAFGLIPRATNSSLRILVVDENNGTRQASVEVLIRHKINFLLEHISMNRNQNRVGDAASECQL